MLLSFTVAAKDIFDASLTRTCHSVPSTEERQDKASRINWWTGDGEQRMDVTELLIRAHHKDEEFGWRERCKGGREGGDARRHASLGKSCITAGCPSEQKRWGIFWNEPKVDRRGGSQRSKMSCKDEARSRGWAWLEWVNKKSCVWHLKNLFSQLVTRCENCHSGEEVRSDKTPKRTSQSFASFFTRGLRSKCDFGSYRNSSGHLWKQNSKRRRGLLITERHLSWLNAALSLVEHLSSSSECLRGSDW